MPNYRPLAAEFDSRGFHFSQLKKVGDFAIFQKISLKHGHTSYEVVHIQKHDTYFLKDKAGKSVEIPAAFSYPSSSSWGVLGFTYNSLPEAEIRLDKMLKKG